MSQNFLHMIWHGLKHSTAEPKVNYTRSQTQLIHWNLELFLNWYRILAWIFLWNIRNNYLCCISQRILQNWRCNWVHKLICWTLIGQYEKRMQGEGFLLCAIHFLFYLSFCSKDCVSFKMEKEATDFHWPHQRRRGRRKMVKIQIFSWN